jgi:cytochrome c551/c552
MRLFNFILFFIIVLGSLFCAEPVRAVVPANLKADRLAAWCIVPFDAKKRGPAARAQMLARLGIKRCAYDWRGEHVKEFEEEILQYKKHGIEFFAFWAGHEEAYKLFQKHDIHPQVWRTLGSPTEGSPEEMVSAAADSMSGVASRLDEIGCELGLYNHGGWGGEPKNLVAVCEELHERGHKNVGIVYNWHHGHGHIGDWKESLEIMKSHLLCLNLNGMNEGAKPKILDLSHGQHDQAMLKVVIESGYEGPIGILDHRTELDTEVALRANLEGLDWLIRDYNEPGSAGLRPIKAPDKPKQKTKTKSSAHNINIKPLDPESNPYWDAHVNRDRVYDFYARQAIARDREPAAFPGLDGGYQGHWGNQNDQETWKDGRVKDMDHGSMVSGVFRGQGLTIARAVSVRLPSVPGQKEPLNVVFDTDKMRFAAAWSGDLVAWSDVRRGFMNGISMGGKPVELVDIKAKFEGATYLGLYRDGDRIIFSWSILGKVNHRTAVVMDGKVHEVEVEMPEDPAPQWTQKIITKGKLGTQAPYAIDTLTLPYTNPWKALIFPGGHDFVSAQRIAVCTIHGDVWVCDVSGPDLAQLSWKRFAAGLHQPLGLKAVDGIIYVMCRDQIVVLHDRNNDDEADYYEPVSRVHQSSAGGHDFITGLERDLSGRWFFASGKQGLCRVDNDRIDVLGTGLRNPNGLGISPDGSTVLTSVQEGNWTPASAICDVSFGGHFGAGGPREGGRGYVPPMLYLPRGVDNSCGEQVFIDSERWGPLSGQWVHFSSGFAKHFIVLREPLKKSSQGAAVVLPGSFLAGSHRGRFSPYDGQLYVASSQGWGNYGVADGGLQRVRYNNKTEFFPYPVAFEARENGILMTFANENSIPVADHKKWYAQHWNYRYGPSYGSREYSVSDPARIGHERLEILSIHRIGASGKLFIEIPQIQPVNQLHLHLDAERRIELFATIHELGEPFTDYKEYKKIEKTFGIDPVIVSSEFNDPEVLMGACKACHHPMDQTVGPSIEFIRGRYADNPKGIVEWAMNPKKNNPQLPPMPPFAFLGEKRLRIIAEKILE